MADVNANIGVHIDTSAALAELKALQRQLATFHSSVAKNSAAAAAAQKGLQTNLLNAINATGKFHAQMGLVRTSTESFTHALETNKLSMREYFRYAGGSTKTFGRLFKQEFNTIGKVAEERVKKMQTQYIKMGRDASGAMKAISITPNTLNMQDYSTRLAVAAQKQALLNQLLKQGSTNLLNFGKNTQWAGRQLMVGFTIPLAYLGTAAAKTFMDLEAQAIRFKRVYGDIFTTTDQTNKALDDIRNLAESFTKYGIAVVDTMKMAADAAAMGKMGADLTAQVAQATRLSVLGGVEQQQALETTISITNAFGTSAEDLAKKINFLNAVENQTVVSIEDLTIAIPKAGPVVKQLGGDVEDLAFFLTAMKEGGINASEGANALKSGLAALINPTKKASEMLAGFGINIKAIVEGNQGNIQKTVIDFARALDTLDPLNRARAIEQLFGKFQFSRLSTLFQNVTKDGTQASKVLGLTTNSVEQLAIMSERELGVLENAVGTKFKKSIQDLKLTLEPIGKTFLEAVTPIVQTVAGLLDKFNNLGDGTKKFIVVATTLAGIVGPVLLMTFGLLANGLANIIKLFVTMRSGFLKAGGSTSILAQQTQYLNTEQLEAATVAASLNQAHTKLTQSFTAEASAVRLLRQAYIDATAAAARFAATNPGMMMPGFKGIKGGGTKGFSSGTTKVVGGESGKDSVPALLTPGEAVVPEPIAQDNRFKPLVAALVSGEIAKYETGTTRVNFAGNTYNASGAKAVQNARAVQQFLDSLIRNADGTFTYIDNKDPSRSGTFTRERLNNALTQRSQENRLNLTDIKRKLVIGSGARGSGFGTSKPSWVKTLMDDPAIKNDPTIFREQEALERRLRKQGITLSQSQRNNVFGLDAAHIVKETDAAGNKVWRAANIAPEPGYINKYINDQLQNKNFGRYLQNLSDQQLAQKGIDRTELNKIINNGDHPTTARAAQTLRNIAREQIRINPGSSSIYQAHLVDEGIKNRLSAGTYRGGLRTLADRFSNARIRQVETVAVRARGEARLRPDGRIIPFTGQNTERKPASVPTTSRNVADNRMANLKPNETVVQRIARLRGFADAPKVDARGVPLSQVATGSVLGPRSLQKLKDEQRKQNEAIKQSTKATQDFTKETLTTKEKLTQFSSKATMGVGAVSGLTIAASFAGGKLGEMAQTIMPFVFGLQGIVMLLPLLANPWVAAVAAIAVVGGILYKMAKDIEKARQEGINLANSMSMTSKKLVDLSVIAGTVSASEEAARRRKNIVSGTVEGQRQFGQNVMGSEFGKQILADIQTQSKSGKSIKEISQNLANNLAVAVAQGAVTTSQARSIAAALGEELGSYEIPALVSGKLVSLLGPNGENLATDPLKVTLEIQKQSMQRQSDAFRTAIDGAISTSTAPNLLARVAGVGMVAAGSVVGAASLIGAPLTAGSSTLGLPAAGTMIGAGLATGGFGVKDENKRKQVNVKLAAAAVQLGVQEIAQNQGLVDSLNKQYDIKLKSAKTEQEIKTIQEERKASLNQLNASNAGALNLLVKQRDQLGAEAFTKGIKAAADAMYKEGPMVVFKNQAIEALNKLKDSEFKTELQIGLASGQVSPTVITKILSTAAGNKGFESSFKLLVDKQGLADAALIAELLPSEGATDTTRTLMLAYINNNSEDFDKDMQALSFLNQINPTYGITLDLKANGIQQLATATNALKQVETLPDKLTKEAVAKLAEENPGEWKAFYDQWTILSEDKDTVNKNLKVVWDIVSNDPNFKGFSNAAFKKIAEIIAKGETLPSSILGGKAFEDKTLGKRDTFLDDLLTKLKLFRKESVNALGGWNELLKQLGNGKTINNFDGVVNKLSKLKVNESVLQFAEGLNAEEAAMFFDKVTNKAKSGQLVLSNYGKAFNQLFPTVQAGIYLRQQEQIKNENSTQIKALGMLKAKGIDAATALQMLADPATAAAIATGKIKPETFTKIADETRKATIETRKFEAALKAVQFEADEMAEGAAEKLTEKFDYSFLEIERKARDTFKSVNKMSPEAMEISVAIDERAIDKIQEQISGINGQIKSYNRTLDLIGRQETAITETYDQKIDSLNKQKDALESIKSINSFLVSQQQKQLGLADALTRGDVSAAAVAAQEMRAEAAQEAINRMGTGLETAVSNLEVQKQKELSSITAVINGQKLTRKQIEAQIVTLSDQIYNIEVTQLEPLQKQADAKRQLLSDLAFQIEKEQKSLEINGMTRQEWNFIQQYVDAANKNADTLVLDIDNIASSSSSAAASWKSILDSMRQAAALKATPMTGAQVLAGIESGAITKSNITLPQALAGAKQATANIQNFLAKYKMYGGKILPMNMGGIVPKYFGNGGDSMGSDTVPAMLTPGEFVMNKRATQEFGPLLSMLNESKYPSMIGPSYSGTGIRSNESTFNNNSKNTYNYNVGITVGGTNASPDNIARAVMSEIKYLDAQRIRGQRTGQ